MPVEPWDQPDVGPAKNLTEHLGSETERNDEAFRRIPTERYQSNDLVGKDMVDFDWKIEMNWPGRPWSLEATKQ